MRPTVDEPRLSSRLSCWRRAVAGSSAVSLLVLLCLLGFGTFRQPSTAQQFRSESQSCMALDQRDGTVDSEAALSTPALQVWLQVLAPAFVPQPRFLPYRPDPLPQLRDDDTCAHARRGPPRAV